MLKKPSLTAICRNERLDDFSMLLQDISDSKLNDRRSVSRVPQSLVLCIQPLNNDFQPVGDCFQAVTRDVSAGGLGFHCKSPFPTKYVRVGPSPTSISQSNARVCYSKAIYGEEVLYLVGVEFFEHD